MAASSTARAPLSLAVMAMVVGSWLRSTGVLLAALQHFTLKRTRQRQVLDSRLEIQPRCHGQGLHAAARSAVARLCCRKKHFFFAKAAIAAACLPSV